MKEVFSILVFLGMHVFVTTFFGLLLTMISALVVEGIIQTTMKIIELLF